MAASGTPARAAVAPLQAAIAELKITVQRVTACMRTADEADLGEGLIDIRELGIDPLEAAFAMGLRRFNKSREYAAGGALSAVAWVRERCMKKAGTWIERKMVAGRQHLRRGGCRRMPARPEPGSRSEWNVV